jgi:hypothetical protein
MTTWWPYARLAAAVLIIAAVIGQLQLTLSNAMSAETEWGRHLPTVGANFLSFFTIQSNVLAAVVLAIAGVWALRQKDAVRVEPRWLATLLACAATYMIVTGIVYNVLLRGVQLPQGATLWWSNEVLNLVAPLFLLADVLFAPRQRALPWSTVVVAAVYPIAWVVYTLARSEFIIAPATGEHWWFPYPFLNWHEIGFGIAAYIVGIAAAIIGIACFVVWVRRRRSIRSA